MSPCASTNTAMSTKIYMKDVLENITHRKSKIESRNIPCLSKSINDHMVQCINYKAYAMIKVAGNTMTSESNTNTGKSTHIKS